MTDIHFLKEVFENKSYRHWLTLCGKVLPVATRIHPVGHWWSEDLVSNPGGLHGGHNVNCDACILLYWESRNK